MQKPKPLIFKVIILGESGVGKSCIIDRYKSNTFDPKHAATVGSEFSKFNLPVEDRSILLHVWDTAGQQTFRSVIKGLYKGAYACLITFNIADRKSFQKIDYWLNEARDNCSKDCVLVLVGAQADRTDQRVVTKQEAQALVGPKFKCYVETSAKDSQNIQELFVETGKKVLQLYDQKQSLGGTAQTPLVAVVQPPAKKKCCI